MSSFIESLIKKNQIELDKEICVLGVDLGTTNSSAAEVRWIPGESPVCRPLEIEQPTREGMFISPLVPSVVAILPDNQVWVGEGPKRLRAFPKEADLHFERNLFYETKNEMGLRKTYFRAPEAFNHASKIAGHILSFLTSGAEKAENRKYEHISVTVPASFQLNQRRDTLLACQYAGLSLRDHDLLDEPTAALIDYIQTEGFGLVAKPGETSLCVVFDFGGGTCDVSVVEITVDKSSHQISMSQLSVSRYHRLGGGDIDSAIVHACLIPELFKENGLAPLDLAYAEKKRGLEPQLLGKAEALKIALCKEVERLKKFGRYAEQDKNKIIARQPSVVCQLGKREFHLSQPALSADRFEELIAPFIDKDFLYARETEYRLTQSIFAPLEDALQRAGKEPHEIDFCLMVGGSSLIPQVQEEVESYFHRGIVAYFKDHLAMQVAVARGAAWNTLVKALTGRPIIQPVLHDGIVLVTEGGKLYPLIPARTALPFPADGSYLREMLAIPKQKLPLTELRFEIVSEEGRQHIFNEVWRLPEGTKPGDEVILEHRVTAGKQFECRAFLTRSPESVLAKSVENPLVNILNPHEIRLKIEKAEEELRLRGGGSVEDRDIFVRLAGWYSELNQREKALDYLRTALNKLQRPDPEILMLQGIYYDELGDYERSEKAYLEADRYITFWDGVLFNLALSLWRRGLHEEALETIEKGIKKAGANGPNLTLKAMCLASLGQSEEAAKTLSTALRTYSAPDTLTDWELGWYSSASGQSGDDKHLKKAAQAREKRRKKGVEIAADETPRPAVFGDSKKEA
jgi:molecular chaperone DnaK (HSP70)